MVLRPFKKKLLSFTSYLICIVLLLLVACNSNYAPELHTRGYFKIDFPKRAYQSFNQPGYPFTFEYPVYARVVKDSTFFEQTTENPYWLNIDFPQFDGRIHISYKQIGRVSFDSLVNDAFKLAYKQHTYKASAIEPVPFTTTNGVEGIYFTLKGNTATANQFFVTDSVKHFLRGALYFNTTPNEDSIRPVNDFLRQDLQHLINTLKWR